MPNRIFEMTVCSFPKLSHIATEIVLLNGRQRKRDGAGRPFRTNGVVSQQAAVQPAVASIVFG